MRAFHPRETFRYGLSMRGFAVLRTIASCALVLLSLHEVRGAPAAAAAQKAGWQSEWERALAGAKNESAVYLWGDAEITHPDIIAAFTKEFPFIKPITVTGKGGDLTVRILVQRGEQENTWLTSTAGP